MIDEKVLGFFHNSNVLITGGTGLIGRQIVDMMCNAGAHVTVVSLEDIKTDPRASFKNADLRYFQKCIDATRGMDFVFHLAGIKGSIKITKEQPASFFVPMLQFNTNVLEACRINEVKKIVYTSSIGAYSPAEVFKEGENADAQPMDFFPGWAKRMAEKQIESYAIEYGLDNFAIVRLANCFGPGDNFNSKNAMVIPALLNRIYHKEDPVVVWGDGSSIRDFAYSRDVAEGTILALYHGTSSKFVNLGSGEGYTIQHLVETLNSFIEFNYKFDSSKPSGFPKRIMDISLARKTINYSPTTSLLDGLKETWKWFMDNNKECLNKQNYFRE